MRWPSTDVRTLLWYEHLLPFLVKRIFFAISTTILYTLRPGMPNRSNGRLYSPFWEWSLSSSSHHVTLINVDNHGEHATQQKAIRLHLYKHTPRYNLGPIIIIGYRVMDDSQLSYVDDFGFIDGVVWLHNRDLVNGILVILCGIPSLGNTD